MKFQASQYLFFCKLICVKTSINLHWKNKARKLSLLLYLSLCFSCSDDKFRAMTSLFTNFFPFSCIYSRLFPCLIIQLGNIWKTFHFHSIMHFNGNMCMFIISLAVKTSNNFIKHIASLNLMPKHFIAAFYGI